MSIRNNLTRALYEMVHDSRSVALMARIHLGICPRGSHDRIRKIRRVR